MSRMCFYFLYNAWKLKTGIKTAFKCQRASVCENTFKTNPPQYQLTALGDTKMDFKKL